MAYTNVAEIFANMCQVFQPDKATGEVATIQFDLSGEQGGKWWAKIANGSCESGAGEAETADMTLLATDEDWLAIINGTLNPMTAFMMGKVKVKGQMMLATKLQTWFAF